MSNHSRDKVMHELLAKAEKAMYLVLVESNGVDDNEWKTPAGVAIPDFPLSAYHAAIKQLDAVYEEIGAFLRPSEAEMQEVWKRACKTGSKIAERAKGERTGFLGREIADQLLAFYKAGAGVSDGVKSVVNQEAN